MKGPKWLRIKFQQLEILHQNPTVEAYYSVTFNQKLYFTSVFDDQLTLQIKNDLIISVEGFSLEFISLQRWESHVIVFDHEISLSQLKTKSIIKKKFQARKNQIVTFTVELCNQNDILFSEKLINKTIQHYLILENIRLKEQNPQKRADFGACYFKITTSGNQYDIPVQNGNCLIYLPETLQISQYKNGKLFSTSKSFTFDEINQSLQEIQLLTESKEIAGKVMFDAHWVIDVSIPLPVHFLLLHSVEILISQIELKFDTSNDFAGSKLKICCNNKVFQFSDELGISKIIRIKKAVWIVCKDAHDYFQVKLQRNGETLCRFDVLAEELIYCQLIKYKQKLFDFSNPSKSIGLIKFNLQKTKGCITPQYDSFWKQCAKKKSTGSILIQQLSICYQNDESTSVLIKIETEQKTIDKVSNINFFQEDPLIYHTPVLINPKADQTIYLMVKGERTIGEDFIGIAVLNVADIRLGKNPYELDFYKNQEKLGSIHCIINKYLPLTFIKSVFQPQILPLQKTADLKLSISTVTLSPYFFSYKYEDQSEVFCIVEVNRVKKVLILQPTFQQLSFVSSSTSDNLSFNVNVEQVLKLKITIMIGDGEIQQIYGTTMMSIRMQELREKQQISFKDVKFINFAQTFVGKCNLIVHLHRETVKRLQKTKSKEKIPYQNSRNRSSNSKKQKAETRKSISVVEMISPEQKEIQIVKNLLPAKRHAQKDNHLNMSHNLQKRDTSQSKKNSKHLQADSIKLPLIKQKKQKDNFSDILMSMNMRKRTKGGYDYNRTQKEDKTMRDYQNSTKLPSAREKQQPIDYLNLRNSNPNIDRNFQILFPPKKGQTREQQIKSELNKYEEKLRGLKSVLHQISDIDPIEPTIKEGNNSDSNSRETKNFQYAGNQFL